MRLMLLWLLSGCFILGPKDWEEWEARWGDTAVEADADSDADCR